MHDKETMDNTGRKENRERERDIERDGKRQQERRRRERERERCKCVYACKSTVHGRLAGRRRYIGRGSVFRAMCDDWQRSAKGKNVLPFRSTEGIFLGHIWSQSDSMAAASCATKHAPEWRPGPSTSTHNRRRRVTTASLQIHSTRNIYIYTM